MTKLDYDKVHQTWGDMLDYSPAPVHRRRLILKLLEKIQFETLLDIGCGNGRLLHEIKKRFKVALAGADISESVIEQNINKDASCRFFAFNVAEAKISEKFDVIVCSEVIEHIINPLNAIKNIKDMLNDNGYLILTVPSGKLFPIDAMVGHYRHYSDKEIKELLVENGFAVDKSYNWGFPFHSIYKYVINITPNYMNKEFAGSEYGFFKKNISKLINVLFYFNIRGFGMQLFVVARKVA